MNRSTCCRPVRLGDKSTPAAIKRWEEEMEPHWEALGEMILAARKRLQDKKTMADVAAAETGVPT